jgi:hypothetical protein
LVEEPLGGGESTARWADVDSLDGGSPFGLGEIAECNLFGRELGPFHGKARSRDDVFAVRLDDDLTSSSRELDEEHCDAVLGAEMKMRFWGLDDHEIASSAREARNEDWPEL